MPRTIALALLAAAALGALAAPPAPQLLVARTELRDPNFHNAVVLLTRDDASGAIGVIVNRPTDIPLADAFPAEKTLRGLGDRLYFGGPVMPDVAVFAFRAAAPQRDASHVVGDVHISSSPEVLHRLLGRDRPTEGLRVFAGLAGWAPGQLDAEIERGDWRRLPADAESIFDAKPELLWARLYRRAFAVQVRGGAGNRPLAPPVDPHSPLIRTSCRTLPAAPCASTSPRG
jgi:putative transcriptional regulator